MTIRTYEEKQAHAKALLRHFSGSRAVMSSFGKDSMVMLHLIRENLTRDPLSAHQFPMPVIHHRHPWFPHKNEFADKIIRSWALEVFDYLPLACGVKAKPEKIELVARYPFGYSAVDIPVNTEDPLPRRDYVCGLKWILRPKQAAMLWDWDTVFIGHKSSDVDPYEGAVPLKHDAADVGEVSVVFPLRHWTDDDVWRYIEENHVEYDRRRYAGHLEVPDKWLNNDYIHACTRCIDPRNETDKEVLCPKTNQLTPNIGAKVQKLDILPDYIEKIPERATA